MRRLRRLRPSRGRQPGASRAATRCSTAARRAPASRRRTEADLHLQDDGPRGRHLHGRGPERPARLHGHRPHALLHGRRQPAQYAQPFSVDVQQRPHLGRPQRQHHQCHRAAQASLEDHGSIFQATTRHRGHPAPGRALQPAHAGRGPARSAAAARRRLLAGRRRQRQHHRRPRPARLPPAGHRPHESLQGPGLRLRLRNLRLRPHRRALRRRRRARRDGDRRPRRRSRASSTRCPPGPRNASSSTSISRARLHRFGLPVQHSREMLGRLLLARAARGRRCRRSDSGLRRRRRARLRPRLGHPLPPRPDPQPLRRPDLHRAFPGHPRLRRPAEAQSRA